MSIEQKIAELLEESAKLKLMEEETTEEVETISEEEFAQLDEEEQALYEEQIDEAGVISHIKAQDRRHGDKVAWTDGEAKGQRGNKNMPAAGQKTRTTANDIFADKLGGLNQRSEYSRSANTHVAGNKARTDKLVANAGKSKPKYSNQNEDFSVQEDVDALLFGEDLTEEFKVKAATIFEAAVMARVNAEVATLEEAFKTSLAEQAEIDKEEIIEKVDGYLGYVVEQWMSDNEIAIENGLKSDILEGFVDGLKTLFQEHYIEVPEERFDVVGDLQEQVEFLESKLDESLEQNVQMMKELNEMTRDSVTGEFCSDMTDTEVEKFTALAEELSYEDAENFASKLQIIKENYFGKKPLVQVESVVTDSPVQLNEETKIVDANVARYLETFNRIK